MRHTTRTTSYLLRPLGLLMLAALAASVMMVVVLASPAHANNLTVIVGPDEQNTNGECSLREAIINANQNDQSGSTDCAAGEGEDTISISGTGATLALTSQLPPITDAAGLTIEGNMSTIDGQNKVRVFEVASGAELTLNNLTVANGSAILGGGIFNGGTLTVSNSTISGNSASNNAGGIFNGGALTVSNSTISGNSASNNAGGIGNGGVLTVSNSTISGNSASANGGGISSFTDLTVSNSTISGNSAAGEGDGILNNSRATLKNTIVANSPSACFGSTHITDDGGNLDSGTSCGFNPANNSLSGVDPLLGPLADNGGPTQTHALQRPSAAIDAAVECPPPATDQRGVSRPQGAACDIGAFEFVPPPDTEAPNTTIALDPTEPNGQNGWYTSALGVKVSASDGTGGGSGVAETRCVLDPQSVPTSFDGLPSDPSCPYLVSGASVSADGLHTLYAASIDEEGNKEPIVSKGFKIDKTPPSVSCSVSPSKLSTSANNHKLVTITATVTVSDSGGSGDGGFKLLSVTSNQADSGLGKDDVPNDIQGWSIGSADPNGQLRAERYGKDRIYTLTYQGEDKAGNKKTCSATVTVPKPPKKG
jgi:hypothetical protein